MNKANAKSHTHPDEKSGRVYLSNAQGEMKLVANLKEKYMEMKESQPLTKVIRNAGNVLNMNIITINKISSKLKVRGFEIPHCS